MSDQTATVALGLGALNPTGVLALNTKMNTAMTDNVLFQTPAVLLTDLVDRGLLYKKEEDDITNEETKLKTRRLLNKDKLTELKKLMTTQGSYVNTTAQGDRAVIESAGMPASAVPQPLGGLPKVVGLVLSPGGAKTQVQAKWDTVAKTLGCTGYMVYWGPSPDNMPNKEYTHTAALLLAGLPSGADSWICVQALGKDPGPCSDPVALMVP